MAHVCRLLFKRQQKIDKGRGGRAGFGQAAISWEELRADFTPAMMTDSVLANRLRERCDCQPRGVWPHLVPRV